MGNYQFLGSFTLSASGGSSPSEVIDIDCQDLRKDFQLFITRTYQATGNPTDVVFKILEGNGVYPMADPSAHVLAVVGGFTGPVTWETTGEDRSSELTDPIVSHGTPQTITDKVTVYAEQIGRFLRLSFEQSDGAHSCLVTVTADI